MIKCYPELREHSQIFNNLINQYISLVNKTLSSDTIFNTITPGQYGQIHVINEYLATLKISATSFLEYTRLIIEHCDISPSGTGSHKARLSSVFNLGNNLGSLVDKIKMDLEEINTQKISSISEMLSRIETITCNFTSAVNETAQRSKECYDNLRSVADDNSAPIQQNALESYFGRN